MGKVRRALRIAERFLGSRILSLACFMVLAFKAVDAIGWQLDELLLLMVLYINFSTRIELISDSVHDSAVHAPEGGSNA